MNRSFNGLCSALKKTGSRCLAENDIPNHHHGCYETECPGEFIQIRAVLPRRARFNPQWKMGVEGVFLRESVIETEVVENLYATPKAFNYLITRLSGEDWSQEQEADNNGRPPITLESFEDLVLQRAASREKTIAEMLRNEKNRGTPLGFNDLQLCELIDNQYVPQYRARSVYQLSSREKNNIASELYRRRLAGEAQIRRCLIL